MTFNFTARLLQRFGINVVEDNVGSALGQFVRDCQSVALAAARDQGYLAFQESRIDLQR
jgi:hypothetical protein